MEVSPWLDPQLLLKLAGMGVFLIVWFLRLEFKVSAIATRQKDMELEVENETKEGRVEHSKIKEAFYQHAADTRVHHNEEMFKEFRTGIDRRFSGVESSLNDISRKLDHISKRE